MDQCGQATKEGVYAEYSSLKDGCGGRRLKSQKLMDSEVRIEIEWRW